MTKPNSEVEAVYFCLLPELKSVKLNPSSVEHQLQLQAFFDDGTPTRVRVTSGPNTPTRRVYTFKSKVKYGEMKALSREEFNTDVDEAFVDGFRRNVKHTTYDKTRYVHPKNGLLYEFDVFRNHQGKELNWCKLDVEAVEGVVFDLKLIEQSLSMLNIPISRWLASYRPEHRAEIDKIWKTLGY